jgi:hypothetical protein
MIPFDPDVHALVHKERTESLRRSFAAGTRTRRVVRRSVGRWLVAVGLRLELGEWAFTRGSPDRGMPFPAP